ncbi:ATP-binding cassette domain-containing protein [Pseudodesulfovibrio sp. zrk46]|uniref:peptidase domain-containing ABC transporter n=1 Tax=Pseudodesulfovibrio sp. zrk46 TaxID=2725288 RepID=UPI0014497AC1|nr:ATP-binding cassette domain-containing protein [Pseudodesulfovibrio sp. zrk46]QJB56897.1 ATP-binding cassette domain-containing protein [Pseudodesulfovibrio sp. zrk46]
MQQGAVSSEFTMPGGLGACIPPLLDALGWRGSDNHLAESMPHLSPELDLTDLLNVMANLKFGSRSMATSLNALEPQHLPCLFLKDTGDALVLAKSDGNTILAFDATTKTYSEIHPDSTKGTAFFFSQVDSRGHSLHRKQRDWFIKIIKRFGSPLRQGLIISFLLSLLALTLPLFVMTIYDQMPFFNDNKTLAYIVVGVLVFIFSDFGLRLIRSGILSFVSARMGNIVGNEVFRRILYMPPAYTESASIGAQASRIKDFDSVRDFFSGQAFVALLEVPFIILLIVVMGILGGSVIFVPLAAICLFALLAAIYLPLVKAANAEVSTQGSARQELVMEMLTKMEQIKQTSTPVMWDNRYRQLSAESAAKGYKAAQLASQINILTNALIMGTGVGTMAVSVNNVLAGSMTMGALVACMILVWRVLSPLRSGFVVMLQLERINKSVRQVDRLMNLDIEQHTESLLTLSRELRGNVEFSQVSIRYMKEAYPALLGVSFSVSHGEILGIVGHDGAGKSTILKLIMGLYKPQAGRISLDHTSLRQMDPLSLRRSIGYTPQEPQFFYGTIAQNLRLINPVATDGELQDACLRAGVLDEVEALSDGLNTRIGDYQIKQMPITFLKKLNLARTLIKQVPLLLLDETMERADFEDREVFIDLLDELRGKSTVIAVTNNSDYLAKADKILWIEKGRVRKFGPREEVIPLLPEEYKC